MKYDIIGDIHGCAKSLISLLVKLGYQKKNGIHQQQGYKVIFLGDFIDRGPYQREVINIVRPMIDNDYALSVMGNHEYNIGHPDDYPLYYIDMTDTSRNVFSKLDIINLENESVVLSVNNKNFNLIGLDDMLAHENSIQRATENDYSCCSRNICLYISSEPCPGHSWKIYSRTIRR